MALVTDVAAVDELASACDKSRAVAIRASLALAAPTPAPALEVHGEALASEYTTIVMRNIPRGLNSEDVLVELCTRNVEEQIDVFYLPMDFDTNENAGYAIVNVRQPEDVANFVAAFHEQPLRAEDDAEGPLIRIEPSPIQGKEALINEAHNLPLNPNVWQRPMLF